MASQNFTLTATPQKIASSAKFIEATGGSFKFWFSSTAPNINAITPHSSANAKHINYDGEKGDMWAWIEGNAKVILTVS